MRVLALTVIPTVKEDGVYINLFTSHTNATIGPLEDGVSIQVLLEEPVVDAPAKGLDRRVRQRAMLQERRVVERAGAKVQKASGALPGMKGDGRARGRLRIEAKTTVNLSYSVNRRDLDKIRSEATGKEVPAFVISFLNPRTRQEDDCWVLIPYEHWNEANDNRRPAD